MIHELYPDDSLRLNDNMTVRGKHFQTIVRTMSHSECEPALRHTSCQEE